MAAKNPITWFEIYVDNTERAKKFYESVFQVSLTRLDVEMPEMWAFPQEMTSPGASGALAHVDGMAAGGNSTLVYFECDDCAVEQDRVADAGGKLVKEKFSIGDHGFAAMAFDSEGNMFGLHSMR